MGVGVDAAELEKICGAWPGASAVIRREDELVLSVAGRAFATLCLCGPERDRLSFAVEAGQFVELTEQPGAISNPAVVRRGFVSKPTTLFSTLWPTLCGCVAT